MKIIIGLAVLLVSIGSIQAAPVPMYLRFHEEAQATLDTLDARGDTTSIDRLMILHNLAFHHYEGRREQAEDLIKDHLKNDTSALVQAYRGSLAMIKVSDRGTAGNAVRGIGKLFGVSRSAYDEGRDGFRLITQALFRDSVSQRDPQLRLMRAAAAVEAVVFLPEVIDAATNDLEWLDYLVPELDSAQYFYTQLIWAKYFYAVAQTQTLRPIRIVLMHEALRHLAVAYPYAISPVLIREYEFWLAKVRGTP